MSLIALPTSSLSSWGVFTGRRRGSDSPYVESVWEGAAIQSGVHLTAADGTIDLVCFKRDGVTRLILSGPTTKVRPELLKTGDETLAIRLRTGVYLPFIAGSKLNDVDALLPTTDSTHFVLNGIRVAFPTFDNVEIFVEQLARLGLLRRNTVLEHALKSQAPLTNARSLRRYCLQTNGLTISSIRQIARAENARSLLASERTLTQIAYDTGYSNSGHMTNSFKHFFGHTPSALRELMQRDI
jgi:hypothetical protein